jgi:two-component system, NarL family, nitrate/nitrite response regulator NarL
MSNETREVAANELTRHDTTPWSPDQPIDAVLLCKNSLLRSGLKHLLADTCFAASDAAFDETSPLPCGSDATPALFIVDANDSNGDVAEAVRHLKVQHSQARVVVVADCLEPNTVLAMHNAGADGFCLTSSSRDVLIKSLELVVLGHTVLPSTLVLPMLRERVSRPERSSDSVVAAKIKGSHLNTRNISPREAEVLGCLAEGLSNKVIAQKLDIAEATIKVHVKAILRKIGATNRTQAAMWATEHLPMRDSASLNV